MFFPAAFPATRIKKLVYLNSYRSLRVFLKFVCRTPYARSSEGVVGFTVLTTLTITSRKWKSKHRSPLQKFTDEPLKVHIDSLIIPPTSIAAPSQCAPAEKHWSIVQRKKSKIHEMVGILCSRPWHIISLWYAVLLWTIGWVFFPRPLSDLP